MPDTESSWRRNVSWKTRYSQLYSSPKISLQPKEESPGRISFMSKDNDPYAMLLRRIRLFESKEDTTLATASSPAFSLESALTDLCNSNDTRKKSNLGVHDTLLLNLVRMRSSDEQEVHDKPTDLPNDRDSDLENERDEPCTHGYNTRMTDRSISRSRFSRASTRRDIDIPSILAFNPGVSTPKDQPGIPAFQRIQQPQAQDIPKWSIRRSVCPVCSQKWKDRSSLANIKYSGLKRNSSLDLPFVTVPARLKTSIAREYAPRPLSPDDGDRNSSRSSFRNTSASWQLVRARRLRMPKTSMPSDETMAPTASAIRVRVDLDRRVKKFLSNDQQ